MGMVGMGRWLDWVTLEAFSDLYDSILLEFTGGTDLW